MHFCRCLHQCRRILVEFIQLKLASQSMQQVRAALRPLHLLTLGEALADDGVHRGLGQA